MGAGAGIGGWAAASASSDSPSSEQRFVELTANERAARSIGALSPQAEDLVRVARDHAARMAAEQRLHHNPNLANEVRGWQTVGENVGRGSSVDQIHAAFMNSPSHRDNVVSVDYTQVGIGVVIADDGEIWVAEVFRKPMAAPGPSSATAPAPDVGEAPVAVASAAPARPQPRATRSSRAPSAAPTGSPAPTSLAPASVSGPVVTVPVIETPAEVTPSRVLGAPISHMRPKSRPKVSEGGAGVLVLEAFALSLLLAVSWKTARLGVQVAVPSRARRQRSHASRNSSMSPSSTRATLPVS